MKQMVLILSCLTIALLSACGGGKALDRAPEHLISGVQEMKKGISSYQRGCYRQALDHLFRAHERFSLSDQTRNAGICLNNIGNVYRALADPDSARAFYTEAIAIFRRHADDQAQAQALANLAAAHIDSGALEAGQQALDAAVAMAGDDGPRLTPILNNQGVLLTRKGDFAAAEAALTRALALCDPLDRRQSATIHFSLGKLKLEMGQIKAATGFFSTALAADRTAGFHKGIADDLAALGNAWLLAGDSARAADCFQRSIKIYALIQDRSGVETIRPKLAAAARAAEIDTRITAHFVGRWLDGKALDTPCR